MALLLVRLVLMTVAFVALGAAFEEMTSKQTQCRRAA
jgi:hypothetical protein